MESPGPQASNTDNTTPSVDHKVTIVDNRQESQETISKPPHRGRWWFWLLLALLFMGGGFALWRILTPSQEAPSGAAAQPPGVKVKVAPVQTGTIEEGQEYIATLESRRSVNLQPRILGQVSRIYVRAGDTVKAGAPIIQVDPDEQQAAVSSASAGAQAARSAVENARATLSSLEADRVSDLSDLKLSQQQYDRYASLTEQGAVPREERDQRLNELQAARSSLNAINKRIEAQRSNITQAEEALRQAQANTTQQQVQLKYYQITAPFAGIVGDIPVKVGDFVNNSTQLVTITQNQPLEVNVSVPVELTPNLRQGMRVELLNGQGERIGTSKVFFISPNTTSDTRMVLIKSLFDNSENQLRADQYVRARVVWDERPGVLVPATAINRIGGETFVYIAETQPKSEQVQPQLLARQKAVKLGNIQGNNYQVLDGLRPGDRIVVSGLLNLRDGLPIIPES